MSRKRLINEIESKIKTGRTARPKFKSELAKDLKNGRLDFEDYRPYNMVDRFKQAGFVDPIFGIASLRDSTLIEYYCNKFVLQPNHISPSISKEDVDLEKTDPFKGLSKVMRKRDKEHRKRTKLSMHFYALDELERRKQKRLEKQTIHLTQ